MKKKGTILFFIFSIGLFLLASFLLYTEYTGYQKRVERYVTNGPKNTSKTTLNNFTKDEINTLESFREQRNIFLGYESFLNESAINYNPSDFSYANLLKEKSIR